MALSQRTMPRAVRELHILGRRQWRMKAHYVLSSPAAVRVRFLAEAQAAVRLA